MTNHSGFQNQCNTDSARRSKPHATVIARLHVTAVHLPVYGISPKLMRAMHTLTPDRQGLMVALKIDMVMVALSHRCKAKLN